MGILDKLNIFKKSPESKIRASLLDIQNLEEKRKELESKYGKNHELIIKQKKAILNDFLTLGKVSDVIYTPKIKLTKDSWEYFNIRNTKPRLHFISDEIIDKMKYNDIRRLPKLTTLSSLVPGYIEKSIGKLNFKINLINSKLRDRFKKKIAQEFIENVRLFSLDFVNHELVYNFIIFNLTNSVKEINITNYIYSKDTLQGIIHRIRFIYSLYLFSPYEWARNNELVKYKTKELLLIDTSIYPEMEEYNFIDFLSSYNQNCYDYVIKCTDECRLMNKEYV